MGAKETAQEHPGYCLEMGPRGKPTGYFLRSDASVKRNYDLFVDNVRSALGKHYDPNAGLICSIALLAGKIEAIEALAPASGAVTEPVATLINRIDADGGLTTTIIRPAGTGMGLPLGEYPLFLQATQAPDVGRLESVGYVSNNGGDINKSFIRYSHVSDYDLPTGTELFAKLTGATHD
jgi:hypothetical protein